MSNATPVTILGLTTPVPQPYAAGHVCSASEAAVLNRSLVRAVAKGLYKVLTAHATSSEEVRRTKCDEYVASYMLGFAEGHEKQRAISVECQRIAKSAVEAGLYAQGRHVKDLASGEYEALVEALANAPATREEAARRIGLAQSVAQDAHSELLALAEASDDA